MDWSLGVSQFVSSHDELDCIIATGSCYMYVNKQTSECISYIYPSSLTYSQAYSLMMESCNVFAAPLKPYLDC